MNDGRIKWKSAGILGALGVIFVGLGVRLAFLHIGTDPSVLEGISKKRNVNVEIIAPRGKIYDCNGERNVLAMNLVMKDVCANPSVCSTSVGLSKAVVDMSRMLDLNYEDVLVKVRRPNSQCVYLRRFVPMAQAERIKEQNYPGVFFQDNTVRYYPQESFLCHVLGFANHCGVGSEGIERQMDHVLRGTSGFKATGVDAKRKELYWKRMQYLPPMDGAAITLTIDQNIQYMVEKALDEAMEQHSAKGAWAVVQNPKTGAILAMASRPAYDLNQFQKAPEDSRMNRAISYMYEPGSVFKVIAISGALNEGKITPESMFDVEDGAWSFKGKVLRDYHAYHGSMNVADGVKKSSNILAAKVAITLGEKQFYSYLQAFGVGRKTGVDLPGEAIGILPPLSKWYGISISRIPIGHGVSVTALQMVSIYSALANNGFLMKPHIIKKVERSDGTLLYEAKPEVAGRPITEKTATTMREMLSRVTEDGGTGRKAALAGYQVAGKTGTAQKPVGGGYSSSANIASFAGFLPANDPEISIVVVVDEPQPLHTGGVVAAPIFQKIACQATRYMDIRPSEAQVASNNL